jgi:hypothetical protein
MQLYCNSGEERQTLTPWLMKPGGLMLHSEGLSDRVRGPFVMFLNKYVFTV